MPASVGPEIERLIQLLARLPGLGPRSARRAALQLIKKREQLMSPLADAMRVAADRILVCSSCGNVDTTDPCAICADPRRDPATIVVVQDVADLWALERANVTNARYHVLGGTLSALDGVRPEDLNIARLVERASDPAVKEVVLALNATVAPSSVIVEEPALIPWSFPVMVLLTIVIAPDDELTPLLLEPATRLLVRPIAPLLVFTPLLGPNRTALSISVAISPIKGRLPGSRSPPQPKTTASRPAVWGRSASSAFASASGLWA